MTILGFCFRCIAVLLRILFYGTGDDDPVGELHAEVRTGGQILIEGFGQLFGVLHIERIGAEDADGTAFRRADERYRTGLRQTEIDEEGRVVDRKGESLAGLKRLLQRHGESQHDELVRPLFERIIARRPEIDLLAGVLREGEIAELRQGFDIGLGERRELFLGRKLAILGDALNRESRIHVVEDPGVADRRDLAVGLKDHVFVGRDPDMRMGRGRRRPREQDGDEARRCGWRAARM